MPQTHPVDQLIPCNEESPHRNIIWVMAETHQLLKTGECSGRKVYELKRFPLVIDGSSKDDAIQKLNQFVQELKQKCQKST